MEKIENKSKTRRKGNVFYHPTYFDPYHEVGAEELEAIPEILASLSFEHQEVLVLYANGLTVQEIAHMVGLKEEVVRVRLQRARKLAHKIIEKKRQEENVQAVQNAWQVAKRQLHLAE